ncbi:MAG TPA: 2Fe-2S iron-sulfur cluster-binding protein [Herpetosiphonaceae bacterium]
MSERRNQGEVTLTVNGSAVAAPAGSVVAAAIALAGVAAWRRSPSGSPRAPLCGMGVCYECRARIDGLPHQLSCQVVCRDGMQVETE